MDVNNVLVHLIRSHKSLPAIKLAWANQIQLPLDMEVPKMYPTKYMEEINISTEDRLVLLLEQQKKMDFWKNGFEVMVIPSIVVFQNYIGGVEQKVAIIIRNISSQLQKVSLVVDELGPFKLDSSSDRVSHLASGMTFTVNILFNPVDDKDYFDKLLFTTAKSRFAIPLMGIGSRGFLDLPNKIKFGNIPVKYFKTQDVSCINIGKKTARFSISTEGPFCVSPEKGVVFPNDGITFSVSFLEDIIGSASGFLKIKYENGEEIHVELEAESVNMDIALTPTDLEFPDTYIGLQNKMKITVMNNSDFKSKYTWRKYISPTVSAMGGAIFLPHDGSGDAGSHPHGRLFSISGKPDEIKRSSVKHMNEPLYYEEYFAIEPPTGDILPHSSVELTVLFNPTQIGMHLSEAYCDIIGIEERVEVRITGRAIGPRFQLGFDELNIGHIYLGGGHTYEIPVRNVGAIEGVVVCDTTAELTRSTLIKIEPAFIKLSPNQCSAFYMFFDCSGKPGEFYEELRFKVPTTGEILGITITGEVLYPRLEFDVEALDMGNVSIGFPKTKSIILVNKSMNNINVALSMDKDGTEDSLSVADILHAFKVDEFDFPLHPKEFDIKPSTFLLQPLGFQRIDVQLTASAFYEYKRNIQVRVQGEPEVMKELPLKARSTAPTFLKPDKDIFLPECYTGFPYPETLEINNPSELDGVYCFVPKYSNKMRMNSELFIGIAKARTSTSVPCNIICEVPGDCSTTVALYSVGMNDPVFEYNVKCHAIESILQASTKSLTFGNINVLTTSSRSFHAINGTPRDLKFETELYPKRNVGDICKIIPQEGIIPGDSKLSLEVQLTLAEVGPFSGIIQLRIEGTTRFIKVKVAASGIGCSLDFSPPIDESGIVDFGYTFTNTLKSFTYVITNLGKAPKLLEWRHISEGPVTNPNLPVEEKQEKAKKNNKLTKPDKKDSKKDSKNETKEVKTKKAKKIKPYFEILPRKQLVKSKETMTVVFKTLATYPAKPDETYLLWAYTPSDTSNPKSIDPKSKSPKAKLGKQIAYHQAFPVAAKTIHLVGQFESPKLTLSTTSLFFKIEPNPMEPTYMRKQHLEIKNDCLLPLGTKLVTTAPFSVSVNEEEKNEVVMVFEPNMQKQVQINFDGSHLRKDTDKLIFDSTMEILFHELSTGGETVTLRGEVNFPTVQISCNEINFGTVLNGTESIEEFIVTNNEKYCLTFKIYIKPKSTLIQPYFGATKKYYHRSMQSHFSKSGFSSSKMIISNEDLPNASQQVVPMSADETIDSNQTRESLNIDIYHGLDPLSTADNTVSRKDSADDEEFNLSLSLDSQIDRVQYFRSKLFHAKMLGVIGLQEPEQEPNDEVSFFHKYPESVSNLMGAYAPLEIVDVVPMSGVIQSGHSQRFTVVFYAEPNIDFTTDLCCYIENGTSKYIKVKGRSTTAK